MIGQPVAGGAIGSSLGASLSKWLGSGDYSVSRNTLVQRAASGVPVMHSTGQTTTIRHRELVMQVTGSVAFTVQNSIVLNPGLNASFPWLAGIAQQYQEYEWKGLVFHFVPTSGSAVSASSAALGTVMLQTSYRSNDSAPTNKVSMLNEYWANEVVPFDCMAHPIECDPKENPFNIHYVRAGTIPSGDQLLYDMGVTYVATQGQQSAYVVGDLWVTYEVELKKPIVSSNVTSLNDYLSATFGAPSTALIFDTATSSAFLGGLPVTFTTNGHMIIPAGYPGTFSVTVNVTTATTFSAAAMTGAPGYTNASGVNFVGGTATLSQTVAGASATTTALVYQTQFKLTDPTSAGNINFPTPTWTGTANFTNVLVSYAPLS
jgi:hypothetical protein